MIGLVAALAAAGPGQPALAHNIAQTATGVAHEDREPQEPQPKPHSDEKSRASFFGEAQLGLRYDSDVAVDDLDLTSRQADEALHGRLRLGFEAPLGKRTEIKASYSLSQTSYEDFTAFDLQTHTFAGALSHDLGGARAGLSYRFIHARLGGSGLLDMHRLTPTLSGFVAPHLYARAEFLYRDTNFLGRTDRDATTYGGGLDLYLFLDSTRRYVSAGYGYADVNASDPQFSYTGNTAKLGFVQKFPLGNEMGRLKLSWRYQARNYLGITPSIGVARRDKRHRLRGEVEFPLKHWLGIAARYAYSDYSSNLPSADYSQNVVDLALVTRF